MGYFVTITNSNAVIPSCNVEAAYEAVMSLNSRDDLKRGGSWPASDNPKPEGMEYHPDKWFSWMPVNLRTLKSLPVVLRALGFGCHVEEGGDLLIESYDGKSGQEAIFFQVLAPYLHPSSVIEWRGEDGERYRWVFKNSVMRVQKAFVLWE